MLHVLKFGGTSVGAPDRLRRVADVVAETAQEGRVLVVASALARVTRQLSGAIEAFIARSQDGDAVLRALMEDLRARHLEQADTLLQSERQARYADTVEAILDELQRVFGEVRRHGFSPARRDHVLATGERLAIPMVARVLEERGLDAHAGNALDLMVTDATHGEANVDRDRTAARIRSWYAEQPDGTVPVVAGFIGATPEGDVTTLGFEGSDYSASLFAAILEADRLTRYTDVDGLYSDDPETNADARRLRRLSMEKAFALTESGRLGMHPKTLRPLARAGIPMQVRSILDPDAPGTRIIPAGRTDGAPEATGEETAGEETAGEAGQQETDPSTAASASSSTDSPHSS
jgi:aspartate kinase